MIENEKLDAASESPSQLVSVAEASELTGIPRRTINWSITHNKLKAHRIGSMFFAIDRDELAAWIERRKK